MVDVVLIGGGEHACVVADAVLANGDSMRLAGFTDDRGDSARVGSRYDIPWLGDLDAVRSAIAGNPAWRLVLAFGEARPGTRRSSVAASLDEAGARWAIVVHPSARLATMVDVADGAVVLAGVVVNTGAFIGRHCIVNTASVVEHDVQVGEFAQIAPGAVIGGGTTIGAHAVVALGARVRDHVRVGDRALVGMGAVVVADVPPDTEVRGVPARPVR